MVALLDHLQPTVGESRQNLSGHKFVLGKQILFHVCYEQQPSRFTLISNNCSEQHIQVVLYRRERHLQTLPCLCLFITTAVTTLMLKLYTGRWFPGEKKEELLSISEHI